MFLKRRLTRNRNRVQSMSFLQCSLLAWSQWSLESGLTWLLNFSVAITASMHKLQTTSNCTWSTASPHSMKSCSHFPLDGMLHLSLLQPLAFVHLPVMGLLVYNTCRVLDCSDYFILLFVLLFQEYQAKKRILKNPLSVLSLQLQSLRSVVCNQWRQFLYVVAQFTSVICTLFYY